MSLNKLLFLILMCFVSCQKKDNEYEKQIIGDWTFFDEAKECENIYYKKFGYFFNIDGTVQSKPGYFQRDQKSDDLIMRFYGNNSKFIIKGDSLKVENLITKGWENAKIISLTNDTLKLQYENDITLVFFKRNYSKNPKRTFDKVVVSKSSCFGTCPISNTLINNNGSATYFGEHYNAINGFYQFKVDSEELKQIELNFNKANFMQLDDNYSAAVTCQSAVTTTFIRNDSIIKTIYDYANESPTELQWANSQVSFQYQTHKLEKLNFFHSLNIRWCSILKGKFVAELKQSEGFYLMYLLNRSKKVEKKFGSKYKVYGLSDKIKSITSDGQYFKFELNDKTEIILNLGFNFFSRNRNIIKFRNVNLEEIKSNN